MITLTPSQRRELRARAHSLHPVVAIGHAGLTPAVLHEIDVALGAHELVKVRVHSDDRDEREAHLAGICESLDAAPVQHLGKILILWRPAPKPEPEPRRREKPAKSPGRRRESLGAPSGGAGRQRPPQDVGGHASKHRRGAARHAPVNRHSGTTRPGPAAARWPTPLRPRVRRADALPEPSCLRSPENANRRRESAPPRDRNARRGRRSARLPVRRTRSGGKAKRPPSGASPSSAAGKRSSRPPGETPAGGKLLHPPRGEALLRRPRSPRPPARSVRPPGRSARRPRQSAHPPAPGVLRRPRAAVRPAERRRQCVVVAGPRADDSARSGAAQDPARWRGCRRQPCPRRRRPPPCASRSTRAPRER
ncbi:MAG: YhbY family RNA-binding protein [Betaproteobacteria bacterium]|nr:YhbY family RNA-binding protein [Betaproteobacteria bacterium]